MTIETVSEMTVKVQHLKKLGGLLRMIQKVKLEWNIGSTFYFSELHLPGKLDPELARFIPIQPFQFILQDIRTRVQMFPEYKIQDVLSQTQIGTDCQP